MPNGMHERLGVPCRVVQVGTLSVQQPWAERTIEGRKDVENRSWSTSHREVLGIHAGRSVATLRQQGLDPADFVLGLSSASWSSSTSFATIPASGRMTGAGIGSDATSPPL